MPATLRSLWTSTEWGKTVFQFKRFAAASTQRTPLSGLQGRDMAALNGVVLIIGLGTLATGLRDYASGGELRDRTTSQWIVDSVDRSSALGMFFELDALAEKITPLSVQGLVSGKEASRFQSRNALDQLAGPVAGLVSDAISASNAFTRGDLSAADLHKARKLLPGQTCSICACCWTR